MELTVEGRTAFAYTGGRPFATGAPCVVFLHGAGQDHSVWTWQSRWFAHHGHAVLAPDLPGHGRSAGPPRAGIGALAEWTVELLDAAGVTAASVVGHSMGALVALDLAARSPDRVTRLALLGAGLAMPVGEPLLAAAADDDPAAIEMITVWGHGAGARIGGNAVPGIWLTGLARRLLARAGPGVLHADLAACHAYADGPARAPQVRCPTLVVIGGEDRMTPPAAGQALAEAVPQARARIVPRTGHMLMTERPEEVLDALRDHLTARR